MARFSQDKAAPKDRFLLAVQKSKEWPEVGRGVGGAAQELKPQNSNPCAVSTELLTAPATTCCNSEPGSRPRHKQALAPPQPQGDEREIEGSKFKTAPLTGEEPPHTPPKTHLEFIQQMPEQAVPPLSPQS